MTIDCTTVDLKYGSTGDDVIELQKGLKQLGYYTYYQGHYLKVDGIFKEHTQNAVKAFQRDTGHDDDGWFGPKTCPDFKKKLGQDPDNSTATNQEDQSNNPADNKVVENETEKEIIIDAKKYNVIPASRANITIEGIHFIAESITEKDTNGRETQWSPINMMNNEIYFASTHSIEPSYEIIFYLHFHQYKILRNALTLIQNKTQCKVISKLIDSGRYFITFTKTYDSVDMFKVTMKLMKSVRPLEG